jgi:YD repeat-containing protein
VLERAHIVARQFGGADTPDNILLLCSACHREQPDVPNRDAVIDWVNNHKWWGSDLLRRIGEHFDTPQQMTDCLSAASVELPRLLSMCGIHGGVGIKPATIAVAAALIAATPAKSQVQQFYGRDGDYLGTSLPSGPNARQYYDGQGNHAGTVMRAGRNSFVYGSDGSFLGTVTNTGPQPGE